MVYWWRTLGLKNNELAAIDRAPSRVLISVQQYPTYVINGAKLRVPIGLPALYSLRRCHSKNMHCILKLG
jgi:hypothetical protein